MWEMQMQRPFRDSQNNHLILLVEGKSGEYTSSSELKCLAIVRAEQSLNLVAVLPAT